MNSMISNEISATLCLYNMLTMDKPSLSQFKSVSIKQDSYVKHIRDTQEELAEQLATQLKYALTNTTTLLSSKIHLEEQVNSDYKFIRIDLDKFLNYDTQNGIKYNFLINNEFYDILNDKFYETLEKISGYIQNILYDSENKIKIIKADKVFNVKPSFFYNKNKIYISAIIDLII